MSNFGALTDHFSLATATLILVESSKKPVEQSRADAKDENDDIADSAFFGNTAGELFEVSCSYALKSGTLDLQTIKLGEIASGTIREALDAETEAGAWPMIKVSGKTGTQAVTAPTGKLNTFSLPASITLTGIKAAQPIGFTVSAGKLTSCKLSAKIEIAEQGNGLGEPIAHGVSGGTGTVEAEFVRVTDQPAWASLDAWLTEILGPDGAEEGQAAFHTAAASAGFTVSRDAAA